MTGSTVTVPDLWATLKEPDSDVFSTYKDGVDSVWLLGTDSSQAIDLLREVRWFGLVFVGLFYRLLSRHRFDLCMRVLFCWCWWWSDASQVCPH